MRSVARRARPLKVRAVDFGRIGVGGIIFGIGAIIYLFNLIVILTGRGNTVPLDGQGLMILGIGLAIILKG